MWAGWHGLNPALAEVGSRAISMVTSLSWPFPTLKLELVLESGYRFGWVDLLNCGKGLFAIVALLIVLVAAWRLMCLMIGWRATYRLLREIRTIPLGRGVWLSSDIDRPCATPGGRILLPMRCASLPADELIAIVAHERSHTLWRDGWIDGLVSGIRALFWFVPGIAWWCRKIDFDRECACDRAAVNRFAMGRAIARVAQWPGSAPAIGLVQRPSRAVARIEALVSDGSRRWHWLFAATLLYSAGIVLWSQLWLL